MCVCVFPSLDCIVEKKVASQRPIAPSLTCLTGTGASGRLRTVHDHDTTSTALYLIQRHRSRLEDEARACISQQRAQQRAHQRWQQNRGTATPCGGYVPPHMRMWMELRRGWEQKGYDGLMG